MQKKIIPFLTLTIASLAFAGNASGASLAISNYTTMTGSVFLGTSLGPAIGANGASINWSPGLNGIQPIGLQAGSINYTCYLNGGRLVLNSALYKGDTITIIYGQLQFPVGIACGCIGSACAVS